MRFTSRSSRCMLLIIGLALASAPAWAGGNSGGCLQISAAASSQTTIPGEGVAIGGSITNCGSGRIRFTLTSVTVVGSMQFCKADKRLSLNPGQSTLYNIGCTPPPGSVGVATTTNTVTGGGTTASASATWTILQP